MEVVKKIPQEKESFITVVSVGTDSKEEQKTEFPPDPTSPGYVTVLTIGDSDEVGVGKDVIEQVLVYRLPGERLGFGLKFEGGTKANEFVRRLFIQSCAPDSPASRVQSSWGQLSEGDEVLEIDGLPVNTMTRIDCVRSLKDSNVVIKLLVRHYFCENTDTDGKQTDIKTRSVEDLPQVVSAEKKRTPPPPPPVPPRKIPKKLCKNNVSINNHQKEFSSNQVENIPVPVARHQITNIEKNKKFQSPRSSGRSSYSPDIPRRNRRFSDGSVGPPDAKIYVDLFSQESTQSLSESDDTGSSISTVVDRFGSFPTTTTSSLAGSLPSTPTSIQRHLDFSNLLNYDDEELTAILAKKIKHTVTAKSQQELDKHEKTEEKTNDEGGPLQPPSCFQDAPLSYGNEDMRIIETKSNGDAEVCELPIIQDKKSLDRFENNSLVEKFNAKDNNAVTATEEKVFKKPPVPPRSRDLINSHKVNGYKELHDENMNISNLPRLVDFVPKTNNKEIFENKPIEIINVFLDNERREIENQNTTYYGSADDSNNLDNYNSETDLFSSKWSISSQLATIGEVEEEGNQDCQFNNRSTPIVIVENTDCYLIQETDSARVKDSSLKDAANNDKDTNGKMETLPSDPRQPPDGHEFPDYVETNSTAGDAKFVNYHPDSYSDGRVEKPQQLTYESYSLNSSQNKSSFNDFSSIAISNKSLNKISSASNSDLSSRNLEGCFDNDDKVTLRTGLKSSLHTRSQSLIDMSTISKQKNDRWSLMVEQRRKGLSKLKGLVIPENIIENELNTAINIPEIVSHTTAAYVIETKNNRNQSTYGTSSENEPVALPLASPPWTTINNNAIPKYSPAFKRKSVQVYPPIKIAPSPAKRGVKNASLQPNIENEFRLENLSDAPKSLESITSPTRSDCSFDYVTSLITKTTKKDVPNSKNIKKESPNYVSKLHKDLGKSEDESDNDSAVSSSQSSYISRCSPPPSLRSCELLDEQNVRNKNDTIQDVDKYSTLQNRLLKPASVEAINRKNILASAKCRSGRDLKVGSPVIQRKYDDDDPAEMQDSEDLPMQTPPIALTPTKVESPSNRTTPKERSISCDGASPVKMTNTVQKEMSTPSLKVSETNTFVTLKPVPHSFKETKSTPKLDRPNLSLLKNNRSMSVTDLRKSFEQFGGAPPLPPALPSSIPKVSRLKNTRKVDAKPVSGGPLIETKIKNTADKIVKVEPAKMRKKDPLTKKPENGVKQQEEASATHGKKRRVVLSPEFLGGSIGITLAGGNDYETKEITVHKIRYGSVAYNDGNLKKGDRIFSINGRNMEGLSHAESVEMLKESLPEFVLIVEDGKEEVSESPKRKSFIYENSDTKSSTPPLFNKVTHVISMIKDGAGLGFSVEGGKDSLEGDLPLRIKKIFQGGAAEKTGQLNSGDELLAINDISLTNLSRIEAWSLIRKLPDGNVTVHIHR